MTILTGRSAWGQCAPQKIINAEAGPADRFGYAVATEGNTLIVGERYGNGLIANSGTCRLFTHNGSQWLVGQQLEAIDAASFDDFGISVALSGDVIVIGAMSNDDNGTQSGAAYVFRRIGNAWSQEQKLLPLDGAPNEFFGVSVSVSGNVIVVGAREDDDNGSQSGSAYVFRFDTNTSTWNQEQKLLASDGGTNDEFGIAVDIDGNVIVVGSHFDDDLAIDAGATYVYRHDGVVWNEEQKLTASDGDGGDQFGQSVSISGSAILVGAFQDDVMGTDSGSAYMFRHDGLGWNQEQKLAPADGAAEDWYGWSVSIDGAAALVGSVQDDSLALDGGATYYYEYSGGVWTMIQELFASDGADGDWFGSAVAIRNGRILIGARRDDDFGVDSGSAYTFVIDPNDCNTNGIPDACDIQDGFSSDCNGNGVPDECDILIEDCNTNGIPDSCELDTDGDGVIDACENCINDPNKLEPGLCGCGIADDDDDGDGTPNCFDLCPDDPLKIDPGACGCGFSDVDTDLDGVEDCFDGCPLDPLKIDPGLCGCGIDDVDTDLDGTPDCLDLCINDPLKTDPGVCGCGIPDTDTDGDGVPDCIDNCEGAPDIDSDGDGVLDCDDGCPFDEFKIDPGFCGCGFLETDTDLDGTPDCIDLCPNDPLKIDPESCGCGNLETDTDLDGTPDCIDLCPNDPLKIVPGLCDCGVSDVDTDLDGTPDCLDLCPNDPLKTNPGICGCGFADVDTDLDGFIDCNDNCPAIPNPGQEDCDLNGIGDVCEAFIRDCNDNGIDDNCEAIWGGGGIPDPCEAQGDSNGDGVVDVTDLLALLAAWGPCPIPCPADTDGDQVVDVNDLLTLLANWG
ncbi:MAG: hypothetical protein O7G85_05725 [Planctomycetota bacterium]|nr:hypothetical protein [Planctomycetota bacterium]